MIRNLEIRNIALIGSLSLEFNQGLTVLSGETGSGKSIIIDSLAFVLGERADKSMIKHGEDRAFVEVVFDIDTDSSTQKALVEFGFERDNTVIISRTMTVGGKNDCRINGRSVTTAMLKSVSSTLVDIFGQSQHLNLLKTDNHLSIIDGFADVAKYKQQLADNAAKVRQIDKELKQFGGTDDERQRTLDILDFQINELRDAALSVEEEAELEKMHKRVVNTEKIVSALTSAQQAMSEGEYNVLAFCGTALSQMNSISKYDQESQSLAQRLEQLKIEAQDIADDIRQLAEQTDYNPQEIDRMEMRLEKIRTIKRKYGGSVESALQFLAQAQSQYDSLSNASEIVDKLNKQRQQIVATMYNLCQELSQQRRLTAEKFGSNIKQQLEDLGMKGTTFKVHFDEVPTIEQYTLSPSANGYDNVEFLLSANVGEPLKPLAKVISGGEMSRFMLAVKNITATVENIPTMVFDEIDTGISGNIAQMVATKLAVVSRQYQCIVITHLPQIVSMADSNLLIFKSTKDGKTISSVVALTTTEQRAQEVARLTGGSGSHSIANAQEMLQWCANYKANLK